MVVSNYLGSEILHINFEKNENDIINTIKSINKENLIEEEIEYLLYTAAIYKKYKIIEYVESIYNKEYKLFIIKYSDIIDLLLEN